MEVRAAVPQAEIDLLPPGGPLRDIRLRVCSVLGTAGASCKEGSYEKKQGYM